MSNITTRTASKANMELSFRDFVNVPTKWIKKRSSKAERTDAKIKIRKRLNNGIST